MDFEAKSEDCFIVSSGYAWPVRAEKALALPRSHACEVAEWLHGLAEIVKPFSSYVVHGDSACFACDMGEAGPGPTGQHDPDCQIKKLLDHLAAEPKDGA